MPVCIPYGCPVPARDWGEARSVVVTFSVCRFCKCSEENEVMIGGRFYVQGMGIYASLTWLWEVSQRRLNASGGTNS
ncbi:hypothetical protein VTL71DRAFT_8654 [Oculimacula yallundae]|uniref:Uncharacterized protein n=1 Tax=Oculimacula yallundae TaxID=86028 RepID=A0ABR4CY74_9HELO